MTTQDLVPGLAGIPAAESAISYIDGAAGILQYRGHRIETLSEESNFEETCWLLLHGELPTQAELDGLRAASGPSAASQTRWSSSCARCRRVATR